MFKIHTAIACLGLLIACFVMSFAHAQTPPTTVSVYFDTDQHTLTPDSREKLNELIQHLDTVTGADMSISGHTDSRAGQTYNDQLSERRIASVQDYLTKNVKVSLPTIVERKAQGEKPRVKTIRSITIKQRLEWRKTGVLISKSVILSKLLSPK